MRRTDAAQGEIRNEPTRPVYPLSHVGDEALEQSCSKATAQLTWSWTAQLCGVRSTYYSYHTYPNARGQLLFPVVVVRLYLLYTRTKQHQSKSGPGAFRRTAPP